MNRETRQAESNVEEMLAVELADLQARAMQVWAGREAEGLIVIVRALDAVALASKSDVDDDKTISIERLNGSHFVRIGAASALKPFLAAVKGRQDGVPWHPINPEVMGQAFHYLRVCGQITHLIRMARLENYGIAKTTVSGGEAEIEVPHSVSEMATQFAMAHVRLRAREETKPFVPKGGWSRLRHRMRKYVDSVDGWFIRYDNDREVGAAFQSAAINYGAEFYESEALMDDARIGDRTFGEWKQAVHQALGRILCHIEFCKLLRFKAPHIGLGNITTIFARREDVEGVWVQAGLPPEQVEPTMNALTLSIDNIDEWERSFELPCHFYVDFGRYFVLLPSFGALANPYVTLFRHLRSEYRPDWDRSVDQREAAFRSDLSTVFKAPRFHIPSNGFKLRRDDGSVSTDLDAVIVDIKTGSVALVQLKWHDLFGHSLSERESRRRNLLQANRWVERVSDWVGARSCSDVARQLGMACQPSDAPPMIFVITRYAARFTGELDQDQRATWLSWFEIVHLFSSCSPEDPIRDLPAQVRKHEDSARAHDGYSAKFHFSSFAVTLNVRP
ncbi:hypothetical protein [Roseateles oligotrophus]|uniref:NERD domain-containing protein n=1 Tax=Roseateles oligotrophus TaxID=1769250 RepID=A0ABT2YIY4_9BURK|nr:hypothetical protein [Roseateles oligotrophus]MCV2370029.1 hypothetical protein [Roseateles oligotrophus]